MNELQRRFNEQKSKHDKDCRFEQQIKGFDFNGIEIRLCDDDYEVIPSLTIRYCPYCGFDIDVSVAQMLIIKKRTKELIEASPIKEGDIIWLKKPNKDYWKGRGFRSIVSEIQYQEHSDRLLYQNYKEMKNYIYHSSILEEIELYTDQPICNP